MDKANNYHYSWFVLQYNLHHGNFCFNMNDKNGFYLHYIMVITVNIDVNISAKYMLVVFKSNPLQ
jgi:hypothetical protein